MSAHTNRITRTAASALFAIGLTLFPVAPSGAGEETAQNHTNLAEALKQGKFNLSLRYRYEHVSQDGFDADANASTLRTTVAYRSARFYEFEAFLELEDSSNLGLGDQHDDTQNGIDDRPIIPDPPVTEIHQAYLGFHGLPGTGILAGRQEIKLGDQRFVGNVGWRQNRQSYDALLLTQGSLPRTELTLGYVDNANTVTGSNRGMGSGLFNARVKPGLGAITVYYYHLDFDDEAFAVLSSATLGASWEGKVELSGWKLPFRVELAQQEDAADNPGRIDAPYYRLEVGAGRKGLVLKLGYEVLGGSEADGQFNTPLATLHGFNGWADKFPLTPTDGLEDLYVSAGYAWEALSTALIYHRFGAESSGASYGSEIDGVLSWSAPWKQTFAFKFALYDAKEHSTDTDKFWLYTAYSF